MTGKPKFGQTIGVVIRDPGQTIFTDLKTRLAAGEKFVMRVLPFDPKDRQLPLPQQASCRCPLCELGVPITNKKL